MYAHCLAAVGQRIVALKDSIAKTQSSANEETKSSAGDKYETGRAMAQLEIDNTRVQLSEAEHQKARLDEINPGTVSTDIRRGCLVITSHGNFYIAIAAGAITLDADSYFVISPLSPIAKAMLGKVKGESFTFNGKEYLISSVS